MHYKNLLEVLSLLSTACKHFLIESEETVLMLIFFCYRILMRFNCEVLKIISILLLRKMIVL